MRLKQYELAVYHIRRHTETQPGLGGYKLNILLAFSDFCFTVKSDFANFCINRLFLLMSSARTDFHIFLIWQTFIRKVINVLHD